MSNKAITAAWTVEGLSPVEKLVLVFIADAINDEGTCWPSQGTISDRCGVKRETVNRAIKSLVAKKIIRTEARKTKHGLSSNLYFFDVSRYVTTDHTLVTTDHTPCDDRSHTYVTTDHIEPLLSNPNKNHTTKSPQTTAFDQLWDLYPRRVGKGAALKAFRSAVKTASESEIMSGLEAAVSAWKSKSTEEKFIPHPATWLNQERWLDGKPMNGSAVEETTPERERAKIWNKKLAAAGLDLGEFNPFSMDDAQLEAAIGHLPL